MTPAEDLAWEREQASKHEYFYPDLSVVCARIEHFRRNTDGTWTYRAHGPGEQILLTQGGALDVDAIFAGALELPGD